MTKKQFCDEVLLYVRRNLENDRDELYTEYLEELVLALGREIEDVEGH